MSPPKGWSHPNRIDLTGRRFGRLVAATCLGRLDDGHTWWHCKCDCGGSKNIRYQMLARGEAKSCGCFRRERGVIQGRSTAKHGMYRTPEYAVWSSMRQRCMVPTNKDYAQYGGRGITVCDRWSSFVNFLADMGKRPTPEHSIDRKDNNGPYSPDNCRWATRKEQQRNRRCNRLLTLKGRTASIAAWAEELQIPWVRLYSQVSRGWDEAKILRAAV